MNKYAYFAGLFDGEGSCCIQVQQHKYINFSARMSMSLKYGHKVLSLLKQEFGGEIYYYQDNMCRWHLARRELLQRALAKLLPYLKIKKSIAKRFLYALSLFPKNRLAWTPQLRKQVCDIAYTLNPETSRKVKHKLRY
jgi:hypothetical protein